MFELVDVNTDEPVELHFGPDAPDGAENRWTKTILGKGWFVYLRNLRPRTSGVRRTLETRSSPRLAPPRKPSGEQPRRSFEIAAPKGAEEVDHDRLEVLLADAWHLFLLGVTSSTRSRSRARRRTSTTAKALRCKRLPRRQRRREGRGLERALASTRHGQSLRRWRLGAVRRCTNVVPIVLSA